ncbi:MAG: DUF4129 domain-containing protein [Actinocrinis sp.]
MTRGSDDGRRTARWSGGVLAAGVALGLGVAAVGVRASDGAGLHDGGLSTGPAVLLGLGFAAAAVIAAARYRGHMHTTESPSVAHDRLRQATVAVLFAAAVLVPFALLLTHKADPGSQNGDPDFNLRPGRALPTVTGQPQPSRPPAGRDFSFNLTAFVWVLMGVLGAALLVALAVVVYRMMRGADGAGPLAAAPPTGGTQAEDEALADALLAGRSALDGDDARAAIIACYAALEASLERAGVARERADSPSDLLDRAVRRDLTAAGSQSAATLADLFREARFSTHPMTAGHLDAARRSLDEVTALLADRIRARDAERAPAKAGTP